MRITRIFSLLLLRVFTRASSPAGRADLEWAANNFIHNGNLLREQCRKRWLLDVKTCESRWNLWLQMQARQASRERQLKAILTNKSYEAIQIPHHFFQRGREEEMYYDPLDVLPNKNPITNKNNSIALALGIVSAYDHYLHRTAMRDTWLSIKSPLIDFQFFLGLPSNGVIPARLIAEIDIQNDIALLHWNDTYSSTLYKALAIFQWGIQRRAHYILRCNDDVYLRLGLTLDRLFQAGPPARIYAGFFLEHMQVPRLDFVSTNPTDVLQAFKAWTLDTNQYPAYTYPLFAQGNAYILSRDLALSLAKRPNLWPDLPDDITAGLHVDALTAGHFRRIDIPTDYELEGKWATCSDNAIWHFNIHPEHMYHLHLAENTTRTRSLDLEIDGNTAVHIHFDADRDNLSALALAFVNDHRLSNPELCSSTTDRPPPGCC